MYKILVMVLTLSFLFISVPAKAGRGGEKGADEKAYEHASEKARFKRDKGWFDKTGKTNDGESEAGEDKNKGRKKKERKKDKSRADYEDLKKEKRGVDDDDEEKKKEKKTKKKGKKHNK